MKKKKSVKKKFSLKQEYIGGWNYIRESKKYIKIVIYVFVLFAILGFFVPLPDVFVEKIVGFLRDLIEKTKDLNFFGFLKFIFLNNLKSSFFDLVFGIAFGVFSLFGALVKGFLLGFVASMSVREAGILILWRIFPHGILELPAVFISLGLGLRLGTFIFQNTKKRSFKKELFSSLKVFILIVVPLLFVAGVIESLLILSFSG